MNLLSRTNIVTKLLAINLIIAVIVGGCIWFAQSRMVVIDAIYTNLIAREAKAVSNVRRTNRLNNTLNYLIPGSSPAVEVPIGQMDEDAYAALSIKALPSALPIQSFYQTNLTDA